MNKKTIAVIGLLTISTAIYCCVKHSKKYVDSNKKTLKKHNNTTNNNKTYNDFNSDDTIYIGCDTDDDDANDETEDNTNKCKICGFPLQNKNGIVSCSLCGTKKFHNQCP